MNEFTFAGKIEDILADNRDIFKSFENKVDYYLIPDTRNQTRLILKKSWIEFELLKSIDKIVKILMISIEDNDKFELLVTLKV